MKKLLSKAFIIAEIGVNHNGDMSLARDMIDQACNSGADAVKFQTYKTERLVRTPSSEQVRKPVNKDGMERWKPYAKYLKPLLNVLDEDLLKPEDVAYINK